MSLARFSPRAARDLDEHCERIAADNPTAAGQVREAILDYADLIARRPEIGRRITGASARHTQIRWLVVPPYRNYLVFFQPDAELNHGRARPARRAGLDPIFPTHVFVGVSTRRHRSDGLPDA